MSGFCFEVYVGNVGGKVCNSHELVIMDLD